MSDMKDGRRTTLTVSHNRRARRHQRKDKVETQNRE